MRIHRIRNKILQLLYRPKNTKNTFLSAQTLDAFSAIDKAIEKKITPLLSGLF